MILHSIAALLLLLPTASLTVGKSRAAKTGGQPKLVWIDADPACFVPKVADVDDCWAMLMALDAPKLRVVGISTVFGNVDQETANKSATAFLARWSRARGRPAPPLYPGARSPRDRRLTRATRGLARALTKERLSILALGPLTNVARVLETDPGTSRRIVRLIAVMGRRPGELFLTGGPALHVHDLNVIKDPAAAQIVLRQDVPITLAPFSAGRSVTLDGARLARLGNAPAPAAALARASHPWAMVWRYWLGGGGMPLFDSAAVAVLVAPEMLVCDRALATIHRRRSLLFAGRWYLHAVADGASPGRGRPVRYCARARPMLQDWVMKRLATGGQRHSGNNTRNDIIQRKRPNKRE